MRRPQPVTLPMVALAAIIPSYLVIGSFMSGRTLHAPEIGLDRMMTLEPAWSLVYLSLFLAALLPVFVLHQQELIRRTLLAFICAWLVADVFFIAYPTIGPRPGKVVAEGFNAWVLKEIYAADARYNCFPSLHVAQCFIAAFACSRVHRGVGAAAHAWAFLVAVSVVYTKQHYVADAVAGFLLAALVSFVFMRGFPRDAIPERDRRVAPDLALLAVGSYGILVVILGLVYAIGGGKVF